jgi:hypothetical protein
LVLLRSVALAENLAQLVEIDPKLSSAMRQCGSIIHYWGISALAEADQVITSIVKAVAMCMKLKTR